MLSSLTLNNAAGEPITIHNDEPLTKRLLTSAKGLVGVGPLRTAHRVLPTAHGSINETRWEEGRSIALEGEVFSTTSIEDAIAQFRLMTIPMLQTLDSGPALMKWQEGVTGLSLQRLVKLDSDLEPVMKEAMAQLAYQVQFFAEDPRAYSQAATAVLSEHMTAGAGGLVFPAPFPWIFGGGEPGGKLTVTQLGNRPTPIVFKLYGKLIAPVITKLSDGTKISLTSNSAQVATGNFLEVDTGARTVTLNGVTRELGFVNAANTNWSTFAVPPVGSSETYTLTASEYDSNAFLEATYRSAYA